MVETMRTKIEEDLKKIKTMRDRLFRFGQKDLLPEGEQQERLQELREREIGFQGDSNDPQGIYISPVKGSAGRAQDITDVICRGVRSPTYKSDWDTTMSAPRFTDASYIAP
jgi:hypothetical protein